MCRIYRNVIKIQVKIEKKQKTLASWTKSAWNRWCLGSPWFPNMKNVGI